MSNEVLVAVPFIVVVSALLIANLVTVIFLMMRRPDYARRLAEKLAPVVSLLRLGGHKYVRNHNQ